VCFHQEHYGRATERVSPVDQLALRLQLRQGKLQELRIKRGLSQRRLADLAGVSNTSVWKIEQGGGANPATLKKRADVLGVLPTDLLKKGR
jgi:DNA-binding XRE family transcriptional regulator